ncbi:MAG: hypothetical protein IJV35_10455 [Neisseriaceae bacterium]|nr:hypothetical protein [Neisseriaceae bacterium]
MQFIGLPRRDFVSARNDTVFNILKLFDYILKIIRFAARQNKITAHAHCSLLTAFQAA